VRRWLLTLKVMSWIEASALESWSHVRAQDLACFGMSALKPDWPRRIVALSHRSGDAKPVLSTMRLWRSSRCAIDATYVPSWETNTAMVWSLFGATPAIVRVRSPTYEDSEWCLREAELTQHLRDRADFMSARLVADVELLDLGSLDEVIALWDAGGGDPGALGAFLPEFPPLCQVWTPSAMPAWEVKMWRASAALRVINASIGGSPAIANRIADELLRTDELPPFPPPTNNPSGWEEYASIFRELQTAAGDQAPGFAIRLPPDYGSEALQVDTILWERIPDMASGERDLGDVLVALEFLRTEWPVVVDEGRGRGRFLALDCRDMSRQELKADARLSLHRGLLDVRLPVPLWVVQTAADEVQEWKLPGDRPIFTEHVDNQFAWMLEFSIDRRAAQTHYPAHSGLQFSSALQTCCRDGL
jgi:hypothetical protein